MTLIYVIVMNMQNCLHQIDLFGPLILKTVENLNPIT